MTPTQRPAPGRQPNTPFVCTVADPRLAEGLPDLPDGVRLRMWDMAAAPADADEITVVVPPYAGAGDMGLLADLPGLRLIQAMTAGFDAIVPRLPADVALANAVGVHDASTSELALGLTIAALRGLPSFVRAQDRGRWQPSGHVSLADRRVLIVGYGGVGKAVAARMAACEAVVTAVASRARPLAADPQIHGVSQVHGVSQIHGVDELPALLPQHDVVVLTLPLSDATRGLVDAAFLAAMPDGALLVNVARGPVVDTAALLVELRTGRLCAALDVTDPEPLPDDHELWSMPTALITPHVGGASSAMLPRALALLGDQLHRVWTGAPLRGVVVQTTWSGSGTGVASS